MATLFAVQCQLSMVWDIFGVFKYVIKQTILSFMNNKPAHSSMVLISNLCMLLWNDINRSYSGGGPVAIHAHPQFFVE